MKSTLTRCALFTAMVVPLSVGAPAALAQTRFPDKPVRLVVPFPPGGSNDVLGRFLGLKLADRLKEQIVIDNRGGANGLIGTELVANAAPDGYTLLFISTSFAMNAALDRFKFDVDKEFDPIGTLGTSPNAIAVNPNWGVNTVQELVRRAKEKPGAISYGSTGVGGFNHFGGELFKRLTGTNMVHVPYQGGGQAMTDVASGQIPLMFTSILQVLPLVRQGRLNLIAIGAEKRSPLLPDVPTVAEAGSGLQRERVVGYRRAAGCAARGDGAAAKRNQRGTRRHRNAQAAASRRGRAAVKIAGGIPRDVAGGNQEMAWRREGSEHRGEIGGAGVTGVTPAGTSARRPR